MAEAPVFELRHRDGRAIRIFADGWVEGAPEGFTIVLNRIPEHVNDAVRHYVEKSK